MIPFLMPWIFLWTACVALPYAVSSHLARRLFCYLIPLLALGLLAWQQDANAAQRLLASSVFLLFAMKAAVLLKMDRSGVRSLGGMSIAMFFSAWPGMEPENLIASKNKNIAGTARLFNASLIWFYVGLAAMFLTAYLAPKLGNSWTGWCGIAALLATIHFGVSGILTVLVRLTGRPAEALFDEPAKSATLFEFWSKRWNRPFISMGRKLFLPTLTRLIGMRRAVFAIFLISGLLHEIAISYPASGGWGLPLLYFIIQGVLVFVERRLGLKSKAFTWLSILAPLPLLFHQPFREKLIVPLFMWMHAVLVSHPIEWYYSGGLWIMGGFQLAVLLASFQVPGALGWREDLPKLRPFNRKLMWVYGSFIVFTIIGFGLLTLLLHNSFLRGDTAAVALAAFIALFWVLRVLTDFLYFDKEDWPKGDLYDVGHAMLNSLFFFLIASYGGIVVWHFDALRR